MEGKQENIEKTTNSNGSLGNAQIDTREISPQGRYIRVRLIDLISFLENFLS